MQNRIGFSTTIVSELLSKRFANEIGGDPYGSKIGLDLLNYVSRRDVLDHLIGAVGELKAEPVGHPECGQCGFGLVEVLLQSLLDWKRVRELRGHDRTNWLAAAKIDILQPLIVDGVLYGLPGFRISDWARCLDRKRTRLNSITFRYR